MKLLRSHPGRRWLAWVLCLMMVAPYLALQRRASAQRTNPDVYVLDFNNRTKVGGALLGRVAAAQMSLQLSDSLNWNVVPDAQVQRRIQELGLKQPYDRVNRVQIATGVDATAVIYGEITEAVVRTGTTPQAEVKIRVVVEDVSTGKLINGAITDGRSTPRMGFNGDVDILLEEALGKAAFKAREFMDRFRLPEGTVLNTTVVGIGTVNDLDAILNIGARNGVKRGMRMIVTRQREVVGELKVTSVDSDLSNARVIENTQGIRPEDRVRAIFNFGDFAPGTGRTRSMAFPADGAKLASGPVKGQDNGEEGQTIDVPPARITKAGAPKQFTLARTQERNPQIAQVTVDEPPKVVVDEPETDKNSSEEGGHRRSFLKNSTIKMLAGGLLVLGLLAIGGRGGANASRPYAVEAAGTQVRIGSPGAFIRIRWSRPKSINSSQVLQYIVWRTDSLGTPLAIVGVSDTDSLHSVLDSEGARTVNAFDGVPGDTDAGSRTATDVVGIVPGVQYRYQVATAYRSGLDDGTGNGTGNGNGNGNGGGNGGGNNTTNIMSPLSTSAPYATAITPPQIVAPVNGTQVNLQELDVTWQQTQGADTYVVWISKNPGNFSNRVAFGPFRTVPVDQGGDITVTQTLDARSNKLAGARTLYISVGARHSSDAIRPEPNGAIFSAPVAVQPETTPPPPPGSSSVGGKGGKGGKGNGIEIDPTPGKGPKKNK